MKSETCFSKKNGEPLSQYYTQLDAEEAATFIKENYQSSLIAYECNKCESPRVHRRPVCLSQATLPDSFKLS